MESNNLIKRLLAIFLPLIAIVVVITVIFFKQVFKEEYQLFESAKRGMSEEAVIKILGEPYKIYDKKAVPENYYVEGYSFKKREIRNKVFIYIGSEAIAYIYFDDKSTVEDVFVGGS